MTSKNKEICIKINNIEVDPTLEKFLDFEETSTNDDVYAIEKTEGRKQVTILMLLYYLSLVLPLMNLYYPNLKAYLTTKKSGLKEATYVKIKSSYDHKISFCKITRCTVDGGQNLTFFMYRFINYVILSSGRIGRVNFNLKVFPNQDDYSMLLDCKEMREVLFGKNNIKVPLETNLIVLFLIEVFHPFFLFQAFSIFIWMVDDYYYYGCLIIFLSAVSIFLTIFSLRRNRMKMKKRFQSKNYMINRIKNWKDTNSIEEVESNEIFPGDLVELSYFISQTKKQNRNKKTKFPADILLLRNDCFVNEAILTGESKPILKTSNFKKIGKNHMLHNGTRLVQIQQKQIPEDKLVGMIYKTGFSTKKGELISSILFERNKEQLEFFKDSLKFMVVMFIISCIVFSLCLVRLIMIGVGWWDIFLRAADMITIIVPPTLPICLEEGMNASIRHLKKEGVNTLFPQMINVSGKVQIMCFDKTGTITDDELKLKKVITYGTDEEKAKKEKVVKMILACCNSVALIEGQLLGDPLEVNFVNSSGWHVLENGMYNLTGKSSSSNGDDLYSTTKIINKKIFPFESKLQRMSVVTNKNVVFTKGSPEMISSLSKPETIPGVYQEQLKWYTKQGYRVLACGYKFYEPQNEQNGEEKEITREDVEKELNFLGFLIVANDVKKDSKETIMKLKNAKVKSVIVTGDNSLTAISVALEIGIFKKEKQKDLVIISVKKNDLIYENYDTGEIITTGIIPNMNLIMTGKSFNFIKKNMQDACNTLFKNTLVFARMSPIDKYALIEKFKEMGFVTGMCGDGTNDCAAIKFSDCGISVSPSNESSLVSHFSYPTGTIEAVTKVLKQSKASLQTSFSIFKFIILYSVIQAITVCVLYVWNTNLSDGMFLYVDLGIIFPICVVLGRSPARDELTSKKCQSSLLSWNVINSVILQTLAFIVYMTYFFIDVRQQEWFTPLVPTPHVVDNKLCYEATVIFYASSFATINSGIAYAISKPFKKGIFETNKLFVGLIVLLYITTIFLIFGRFEWLSDFFEVEIFDDIGFCIKMVAGSFIHLGVVYMIESFFILEMSEEKLSLHSLKKFLRECCNFSFSKIKRIESQEIL